MQTDCPETRTWPGERDWTRAEIIAWCKATGRHPGLFLAPEPPHNPPAPAGLGGPLQDARR